MFSLFNPTNCLYEIFHLLTFSFVKEGCHTIWKPYPQFPHLLDPFYTCSTAYSPLYHLATIYHNPTVPQHDPSCSITCTA